MHNSKIDDVGDDDEFDPNLDELVGYGAPRQRWLSLAVEELKVRFHKLGYELPEDLRVSLGWPKEPRAERANPTRSTSTSHPICLGTDIMKSSSRRWSKARLNCLAFWRMSFAMRLLPAIGTVSCLNAALCRSG
jgi:hypothetical protein